MIRILLCIVLFSICIRVTNTFNGVHADRVAYRPTSIEPERLSEPHKSPKTSPFYKEKTTVFAPNPNPFQIKSKRRWSSKFANSKPTPPKKLTYRQRLIMEKFEDPPRPHVPRDYRMKDRVILRQIKVGQKFIGKIIAVTDYGLFVDIGTMKDGLVHVKDTSGTYFIEKIHQRFNPGEYIDVWVKFVDYAQSKLGLQMYDPAERSIDTGEVDFYNLIVGSQITGKAVKHSHYGVYLNIGAGEHLAYLPTRMMKLNHRQKRWLSWEVVPLGTEVNCLIQAIDPVKKRMTLTTYPIHDWDEMVPLKLRHDERDFNAVPTLETLNPTRDVDPDEPVKGKKRKHKRGKTPEFPVQLNDGQSLLLDPETREALEAKTQEIADAFLEKRNVKGGVRGSARILLDDYDDNDVSVRGKPRPKSKVEKNFNSIAFHKTTHLTTEQLFNKVSHDKEFITLNKMVKWVLMENYIKQKLLTERSIKDMMIAAGAFQGKLYLEEFDDFLKIVADQLGLVDLYSPEADKLDDEIPYEVLPQTDEWKNKIFDLLTQDKLLERLDFWDLLQWKVVQNLLSEDSLTVMALERAFEANVVDGTIGREEFFSLVDWLIRHHDKTLTEQYRPGYRIEDQNDPDYDEEDKGVIHLVVQANGSVIRVKTHKKKSDTTSTNEENQSSNEQEEPNEEDGDADIVNDDNTMDDESLNKKMFESLAGKKEFITLQDFKQWNILQDVMEQGILTENKLNELVNKHSTDSIIRFKEWNAFSEDLIQFITLAIHEKDNSTPSSLDGDEMEQENVDHEQHNDEMDYVNTFTSISKGKESISYEEFLGSDLIQSMLKSKQIQKVPLKQTVLKCVKEGTNEETTRGTQGEVLKNLLIDCYLFERVMKYLL